MPGSGDTVDARWTRSMSIEEVGSLAGQMCLRPFQIGTSRAIVLAATSSMPAQLKSEICWRFCCTANDNRKCSAIVIRTYLI